MTTCRFRAPLLWIWSEGLYTRIKRTADSFIFRICDRLGMLIINNNEDIKKSVIRFVCDTEDLKEQPLKTK
jgi:predicted RNA-binding protein with PIN domain